MEQGSAGDQGSVVDDQVIGRSRRSGGRAGRHAVRSAPLTEDIKPIRPGMEGGSYKPLTEAGVQRIHEAAQGVWRAVPTSR